MYKIIFAGLLGLLVCSCSAPSSPSDASEAPVSKAPPATEARAKFAPQDGECLLFVGQELAAIGGLETFAAGYLDHFPKPGGITLYTDLMPGTESFGFVHRGLDGLTTTDDWGDGPSNLSLPLSDPDFDHLALAIGLDMKEDHELRVARGEHDSLIVRLGGWLKGLGRRPVLLRIGYEFDGHPWNSYQREAYLMAFRRIHRLLDSMAVENVAYVWQSKGRGSQYEELEAWYPGDEYVDWCGYSFFAGENEKHPMLDFARAHRKPVFLAEATPIVLDAQQQSQPLDLADPAAAQLAWERWFVPFFRTIHEHPDLVKAVSYINCHWKAHPMWRDNDYFRAIDARLHLSPMISERWLAETQQDRYLKGHPSLFDYLWTGQ